MSVVTNVILHYSMFGPAYLAKVNEFFGDRSGFVSVDDESLPRGWYGGSKYLECDLAIGAFNHLDLDGLVRHLCSLPEPEEDAGEVQLMVLEQEEFRFRIINIADVRAAGMRKADETASE